MISAWSGEVFNVKLSWNVDVEIYTVSEGLAETLCCRDVFSSVNDLHYV